MKMSFARRVGASTIPLIEHAVNWPARLRGPRMMAKGAEQRRSLHVDAHECRSYAILPPARCQAIWVLARRGTTNNTVPCGLYQ